MTALLPPGTTIAAIAPSGAYNRTQFQAGASLLQAQGYLVEEVPVTSPRQTYLAGTDESRARQLTTAFTDPKYGAVWAIRGGYGLTRILKSLPFDRFVSKPLIGFSDIVALQIPLAKRGFPVIHGPVIHSLETTDEASRAHLFALLAGQSVPPLQGEMWVEGVVQAPLVGGNLCLLSISCGTPWALNPTGKILVLEDVGEATYRIDRMLQHLVNADLLSKVAGIVVGEFTDCGHPDAEAALINVLKGHLNELGVPVLAGVPIGHGAANRAFVWNRPALMAGGQLHLSLKR